MSLRRGFASSAGGDSGGFAFHLRVDGRPRRVLQSRREIPLVHVEERLERLRLRVDLCPRVAVSGDGGVPVKYRNTSSSKTEVEVDAARTEYAIDLK